MYRKDKGKYRALGGGLEGTRFYADVEPEIRGIVKALRDSGINTISSCGHEMTVLADVSSTQCPWVWGVERILQQYLYKRFDENKKAATYTIWNHRGRMIASIQIGKRKIQTWANPNTPNIVRRTDDYILDMNMVVCKFCGSIDVVRNGKHGKLSKQYWLCKICGHAFFANGALPKWKYARYIVQEATRLRLAGYSLEVIRCQLNSMYKVDIKGTSTLHGWFKKLGIYPPTKDSHWTKALSELENKLRTNLENERIYKTRDILQICGYSIGTKIGDTQLVTQNLINRKNGGWVINAPKVETTLG